ncbi:Beta-glucosidase [Phytophthora megakarya]|uniref:Beta-glucosidase n=1 Tax=Phytophthora megakarya TaxID=4795 RepID=A0A225UU31_9STRA|nr:Beta-glucosidase [Phytophthora megakarya]
MNWDVETSRMRPNPQGIAFYHSLIDELTSNGIALILTIYHWDLPIELHTQRIVGHYVDKVDYWSTFNEPLSFTAGGYALGMGAPGYTGSLTQVYTATHNVLISRAQAVQKFRELKGSVIENTAQIGIGLNADYAYPLDPPSSDDVAAALRKMEFDVG